jgi:hypothetical protein
MVSASLFPKQLNALSLNAHVQKSTIQNSQYDKVVFIYHNDSNKNFEYYLNAHKYYQQSNEFKLVVDATSLEYIHNWLNRSKLTRKIPWAEIHIVTHGSFQKGIALPVMDNKARSKNRIVDFSPSKSLTKISAQVIDENTLIKLLACGVGRHKATISGLQTMFTNTENKQPRVKASIGYQFFNVSDKDDSSVESIELDFYSALIAKSFEWHVNDIANAFNEKYPHLDIDWRAAIQNQVKYDSEQEFSHRNSLVLSALAYKDDLDRLGSTKKYINKHPKLSSLLNKQLVIGNVYFNKENHSKDMIRLTSEMYVLKIFVHN